MRNIQGRDKDKRKLMTVLGERHTKFGKGLERRQTIIGERDKQGRGGRQGTKGQYFIRDILGWGN